MRKKIVISLLLSATLTGMTNSSIFANGPAHKGWYQDGSAGKMYFNEDGSMATGITKVGNYYYLFLPHGGGPNAYLTSGWYNDPITKNRYLFNGRDGAAYTGWYQDGRNGRMYFNEDGVMARGVTKIGDDYYLFTPHGPDSDYAGYYQATGWYTDPKTGKRYYFDPNDDGKAIRGITRKVDGKLHTFTYDGSIY